ncbi:MAG: NYN domain-containing protein, partial [Phycisphaerales bacterium]|nr:NYN domain-containing protein [Phycisphaerales bacterium]
MRVLVDAWNVLHQEGILPPGLAGIDLVGLGRLMRATRWGRIHTTLACDGKPRPRPEGLPEAIHVLWSGHLREADDIMEGLIARSTTPRRLVVVSSDRRLRKAARRRRCRWLSSEDFLRTILDDLAAGDRGA